MEGDAGSGRLSSSDVDATLASEVTADDPTESAAGAEQPVIRPARLGRRWLIGTVVALLAAAGAVGVGGYLALRSHRASEATARGNVAALAAAKECIAAMNAPDAAAMYANMPKVIDCTTDDLAGQVPLFSVAAEAYETYGIHAELLDLRAAVERNNADGSIDVLAVLRQQVSTTGEQSQRLRVTMRLVDGQYKIAKMDRVGR